MEVGFENYGEIESIKILDCYSDSRKASILISRVDFFQLDILERKYMKLDSEEMVSPTRSEIVAWSHSGILYYFPRLMGFHFELIMSMNPDFQNNMILGS